MEAEQPFLSNASLFCCINNGFCSALAEKIKEGVDSQTSSTDADGLFNRQESPLVVAEAASVAFLHPDSKLLPTKL